MATVATKLLTAEEFFDWANLPENRDRRFELEKGEIVPVSLVPVSLPGERHCAVCGNVAWVLGNYVRQQGKGYVCPNDMGLILERDPDTVRGPDVALYTDRASYKDLNPKFSQKLPTLIVEVLSPSDRPNRMMKRIKEFLSRGVPIVWLLDPEARDLTVHRLNQPGQFVGEQEEVADLAELPGFRCQVQDFFSLPAVLPDTEK